MLDGPDMNMIRSQLKALFSPNTDFPLCAYPLVYYYSNFEWELKQRSTTLCGDAVANVDELSCPK
eukprot:12931600-Prorocentrum_lima.AAC.1